MSDRQRLTTEDHEEIGRALKEASRNITRVISQIGTYGHLNSPEVRAARKAVAAIADARNAMENRMFRELPREELPAEPLRAYYGAMAEN